MRRSRKTHIPRWATWSQAFGTDAALNLNIPVMEEGDFWLADPTDKLIVRPVVHPKRGRWRCAASNCRELAVLKFTFGSASKQRLCIEHSMYAVREYGKLSEFNENPN